MILLGLFTTGCTPPLVTDLETDNERQERHTWVEKNRQEHDAGKLYDAKDPSSFDALDGRLAAFNDLPDFAKLFTKELESYRKSVAKELEHFKGTALKLVEYVVGEIRKDYEQEKRIHYRASKKEEYENALRESKRIPLVFEKEWNTFINDIMSHFSEIIGDLFVATGAFAHHQAFKEGFDQLGKHDFGKTVGEFTSVPANNGNKREVYFRVLSVMRHEPLEKWIDTIFYIVLYLIAENMFPSYSQNGAGKGALSFAAHYAICRRVETIKPPTEPTTENYYYFPLWQYFMPIGAIIHVLPLTNDEKVSIFSGKPTPHAIQAFQKAIDDAFVFHDARWAALSPDEKKKDAARFLLADNVGGGYDEFIANFRQNGSALVLDLLKKPADYHNDARKSAYPLRRDADIYRRFLRLLFIDKDPTSEKYACDNEFTLPMTSIDYRMPLPTDILCAELSSK